MLQSKVTDLDRAELVVRRMRRGVLTLKAGVPAAQKLLASRAPAGRSLEKQVLQLELRDLEVQAAVDHLLGPVAKLVTPPVVVG